MPAPRSSRTVADLPASPRRPDETKQQWVYRQLAGAIDTRRLQPGDSVPSTRALAARWGLSRGVVEIAFEQLGREGYLEAVVGRGTRVSTLPPECFLRARPEVADATLSTPHTASPATPSAHPVRAGQPFIARLPDLQTFDLRAWRASIARAARALGPDNMGDADPRGLAALREGVCRHLALSRGLSCTPDDILIVTGIRHAIDLCAQAAVPEGAAVALEDPGYAGAEAIFRLRGRRTVDIPLDAEGIDVNALRQVTVAMAYVTPAHQAPTGVAMSARRRAALLAWAEASGAWLLEDDYDSDFSYERAPLPALKSEDRAGRVLFCGSFNKSLFPGLRIGYIVAPAALMPRLVALRAATGRANPVLDQLTLAEFIQSEALLRQLKKARVAYKRRRDLIVHELMAADCEAGDFQGLHAGFHFVLRLPPGTDEGLIAARANAQGVVVQGLRAFWRGHTPAPPPALVIGYTALSDAQAKWSARQLAALLR